MLLKKKNEIAATPEYNEEYFRDKFTRLLDDIKKVQQKYLEYNKELQREKGICEEKYEQRKGQLKNLDMYLAKQSVEFADSKEVKKPGFFSRFRSMFGSNKKKN